MQKVQVKNWGNSHAIRIPKNILDELDIGTNAFLEVTIDKENNSIHLTATSKLTPYQKLMQKNSTSKPRKQFIWNRLEKEDAKFF